MCMYAAWHWGIIEYSYNNLAMRLLWRVDDTCTYRDRKRKKFVGDSSTEKQKKIKTESGHYIRASYKSSAYRDWRDKHKIETPLTGLEMEDPADRVTMATTDGLAKFKRSKFRNGPSQNKGSKGSKISSGSGLKSKSEILQKRSAKQAQERRRWIKRKAGALKGQSTKRRKGQTRWLMTTVSLWNLHCISHNNTSESDGNNERNNYIV